MQDTSSNQNLTELPSSLQALIISFLGELDLKNYVRVLLQNGMKLSKLLPTQWNQYNEKKTTSKSVENDFFWLSDSGNIVCSPSIVVLSERMVTEDPDIRYRVFVDWDKEEIQHILLCVKEVTNFRTRPFSKKLILLTRKLPGNTLPLFEISIGDTEKKLMRSKSIGSIHRFMVYSVGTSLYTQMLHWVFKKKEEPMKLPFRDIRRLEGDQTFQYFEGQDKDKKWGVFRWNLRLTGWKKWIYKGIGDLDDPDESKSIALGVESVLLDATDLRILKDTKGRKYYGLAYQARKNNTIDEWYEWPWGEKPKITSEPRPVKAISLEGGQTWKSQMNRLVPTKWQDFSATFSNKEMIKKHQ